MKTEIYQIDEVNPQSFYIKLASDVITGGGTVAFPTETVYGIGANALDYKAVKKIYEAKGRHSDNPLIVHIHEASQLKKIAVSIPPISEPLIRKFWPGPITLIFKKSHAVPDATSGGLDTVAIRMPRSNISLALIKESGCPIAAPSANISGKPSPTSADHVIKDLDGKVNMILDGGNTEIGIESTVIDLTEQIPVLLRPGAVTLEAIQNTIGEVNIDPSILGNYSELSQKSPGMKYNHYSPNAQLILVEGSESNKRKKIGELVEKLIIKNKKVGVMTTDKSFQCNAHLIKFMGSNYESIARDLFGNLRFADYYGVDTIIVEGIDDKEMGLAIMNRLRKAADIKVVT